MQGTELIPARFLTIAAHIVILITMFWGRKENVEACLPLDYTQNEYNTKDREIIIGLSLGLALILIEFAGFFSGVSMFLPAQGLLSTIAHCSACISLSYFITDIWDCNLYWWIFGFCSVLPALFELIILTQVFVLKKHL